MESADANGALEQIFDLAVVVGELMNRDLAARGLTPARAEVIWLLGRRGPLTQRVMSQELKCTPRNVTGLIDVLEDLGLVARNPHPGDRRATLVTLTPEGQAAATMWDSQHRRGAGELLGGITPADLATFTKVLDVVLSRFRAELRPPHAPADAGKSP